VAEWHIMDDIPDFSQLIPHCFQKKGTHLVDAVRRPEVPSAYVWHPPRPDDLVEPGFDEDACRRLSRGQQAEAPDFSPIL
jgi:hypothetical protein